MNWRKLLILSAFLALGAGLLWALLSSPVPVIVRVMGQTNDTSGSPWTAFQITNTADRPIGVFFKAEILQSNVWRKASLQHTNAGRPFTMKAHTAQRIEIPTPQEKSPWRFWVKGTYYRGPIETDVAGWLLWVQVRYKRHGMFFLTVDMPRT